MFQRRQLSGHAARMFGRERETDQVAVPVNRREALADVKERDRAVETSLVRIVF